MSVAFTKVRILVISIMQIFIFVGVLSQANAASTYSGIDLHLPNPRTQPTVSILRADQSKTATVLLFLSAKCPCSMSHSGEIIELSKEYPQFRFIGVNANSDESIDMASKYFVLFPFPILKDEKWALANEFKALKTPHAFIIDKNEKVIFQGGVSNSATFAHANRKYLREALEDISAGHPVRQPLARALGCIIDRNSL